MENVIRIFFAALSFIVPLVGVGFYLIYSPKTDAKLFGLIGIIGIFVYMSVGIGFI